jgi:hypothetical protein
MNKTTTKIKKRKAKGRGGVELLQFFVVARALQYYSEGDCDD